jgi:hypothetical protein
LPITIDKGVGNEVQGRRNKEVNMRIDIMDTDMDRLAIPDSLPNLNRTLNVLAITRELTEGEFNDSMLHSWRPHELLTIHESCKSSGLIAQLFDTDIGEPVAAFLDRDGFEAVASVTRCGCIYLLIDSEGAVVREGESLLDVLTAEIAH